MRNVVLSLSLSVPHILVQRILETIDKNILPQLRLLPEVSSHDENAFLIQLILFIHETVYQLIFIHLPYLKQLVVVHSTLINLNINHNIYVYRSYNFNFSFFFIINTYFFFFLIVPVFNTTLCAPENFLGILSKYA